MVKWYLLRNVLLAAVLATVGSGCARSSQTVAGWFDREPKVDANGESLEKGSASKEKEALAKKDEAKKDKSSKESPVKAESKDKAVLADAETPDEGVKKASWFSWGRDDESKKAADDKSATASKEKDKSSKESANEKPADKVAKGKDSSAGKVAANDKAAKSGTEEKPASKPAAGMTSTKAFAGTSLADTKADADKDAVAKAGKNPVKPTRGPSRDLIPADEDPFLAEALADIASGRGEGPERMTAKSKPASGQKLTVEKSTAEKSAAEKLAAKKETEQKIAAAPSKTETATTAKKDAVSEAKSGVPARPKSEVTGEDEFASWIAKIEGRVDTDKPAADKAITEPKSKAEQLVASAKTVEDRSAVKQAAASSDVPDWAAGETIKTAASEATTQSTQAVAKAETKGRDLFAEMKSDSSKRIDSLSRNLKTGANDARDRIAADMIESQAIASTEWADAKNTAAETGREVAASSRQKVETASNEAIQFAELVTEKSQATVEDAWAAIDQKQTQLAESTSNKATQAVARAESEFDWESVSSTTTGAIARKTGGTAPAMKGLIEKCGAISEEVKPLVQGLETTSVDSIRHNVHRLGQMDAKGQEAVPALNALLDHQDPYVKVHSALALSRLDAESPKVLKTLVGGLKSPDAGVRSFSAAVIGELGPLGTEALPALATSLDDPDGYVRLHAAEVLVRNDRFASRALETLQNCLKDSDENIRWLATYSLAELAPQRPDTVLSLLKVVKDPVQRVRVGAVYALGEIGPMARPAIPELEQAATDPDKDLRAAAQYALQQIKS
jgi:hypothetical protein